MTANSAMTDPRLDPVAKAHSRAERFRINIPVRYHEPHSPTWFDGWTENISYSGVLLRTKVSLQPKTTLELRFELPVAVLGEARGEIVCKGAVVRIEESPVSGIPSALAIAIRGYRMTRGGQVQ